MERKTPRDGVWFFHQILIVLATGALILAMVGAFVLLIFSIDKPKAAPQDNRASSAPYPGPAVPPLSHPCPHRIRQGMTSVTMGPERCVTVAESK